MKVIVFGAGGIIGQTMRLYQPGEHTVLYFRRHADMLHRGIDLTDWTATEILLNFEKPDVIINLAGENRPDVVEERPALYTNINVRVPARLAEWCSGHDATYIHMSSQAVFSGDEPPYNAWSETNPINAYGRQKAAAEREVAQHKTSVIVRPTLVLGIRTLPHVGRANPLEQICAKPKSQHVDDRWFSPVCAKEMAVNLWQVATSEPTSIVHMGRPDRVSRYDIANLLGDPIPVSHESFRCAAERPVDTTYDETSLHDRTLTFEEALMNEIDSDNYPASDISLFLNVALQQASDRLSDGFAKLHNDVAEDFRRCAPKTDDELLEWYRTTEAYIWELTAYHLDPDFNYIGMCKGIAEHLKNEAGEILCVGDGVGEMTLQLRRAGLKAVYHDLAGSRTSKFAEFRLWRHLSAVGDTDMTDGWEPQFQQNRYGAIVSADFLEHVTDVPKWIANLYAALKPGGIALFQNAFGLGSGPDGSIPMHLARNDRWITEYTQLMNDHGWRQIGYSNWWQKPVAGEQAA